jgi:flagellar hook-length control protein FliK
VVQVSLDKSAAYVGVDSPAAGSSTKAAGDLFTGYLQRAAQQNAPATSTAPVTSGPDTSSAAKSSAAQPVAPQPAASIQNAPAGTRAPLPSPKDASDPASSPSSPSDTSIAAAAAVISASGGQVAHATNSAPQGQPDVAGPVNAASVGAAQKIGTTSTPQPPATVVEGAPANQAQELSPSPTSVPTPAAVSTPVAAPTPSQQPPVATVPAVANSPAPGQSDHPQAGLTVAPPQPTPAVSEVPTNVVPPPPLPTVNASTAATPPSATPSSATPASGSSGTSPVQPPVPGAGVKIGPGIVAATPGVATAAAVSATAAAAAANAAATLTSPTVAAVVATSDSSPVPPAPAPLVEGKADTKAKESDVSTTTTNAPTNSDPANTAGNVVGTNTPGQVASPTGTGPGHAETGRATQGTEQSRFVQRVARAFQALGDRGGPLRLRLSPPELGSLKLEIRVDRGELSAHIEAETPAARAMLLDNLPALRERLEQQDIKVARFDVDLSGQSGGGLPQTPDRNQGANDWLSRGASPARPAVVEATSAPAASLSTPTTAGGLNVVV